MGKGRFLLGVTHFMVMNDVYMKAEEYGLEIDEAGLQLLLRGALEYDHEIDYWWNKLDHDNRRWVALHTIRSESAPARARAFYRLETIPDGDPPRIPTLVAQALALETNDEAKTSGDQCAGDAGQAGLSQRELYGSAAGFDGTLVDDAHTGGHPTAYSIGLADDGLQRRY